jgi:hypothetical protein
MLCPSGHTPFPIGFLDIENYPPEPPTLQAFHSKAVKGDPFDLPNPGTLVESSNDLALKATALPIGATAKGRRKENQLRFDGYKPLCLFPEKDRSEPGTKEHREIFFSKLDAPGLTFLSR